MELSKEMKDTPWQCKNFGDLWSRLLDHVQKRVAYGPLHWWKIFKTTEVRTFEKGHALLLRIIDRALEARSSEKKKRIILSGFAFAYR